jgi:hypothetical protein
MALEGPEGRTEAALRAPAGSWRAAVATWPPGPRETAEHLTDQYGPPDEVTPSQMTWFANGRWRRTTVLRQGAPHRFPWPHEDFLENAIAFRVAPDRLADLARLDGSLVVDRTRGEVIARGASEPLNVLALNVAHRLLAGDLTLEEARARLVNGSRALEEGRTDPLLTDLQFTPPPPHEAAELDEDARPTTTRPAPSPASAEEAHDG